MDQKKGDIPEESSYKFTEKAAGILRSNSASRSRSRITPLSPQEVEPPSPQPSVDRLSVTFAITEDNDDRGQEEAPKKVLRQENGSDVKDLVAMRRIPIAEEETDEDDYSASACAIMQRRSSTRRSSRRKRRPSSPFCTEAETMLRRRSSVYTISSGETAISIEESGSQEQIFEKLKLHKEVLSGVKQQPWPLRRKIKLVRQAKSYVRKHEGVLQERMAQRRSTRDAIARVSLFMNKKWQYCRREFVNLQTWLIPWELRIKEIESHFGSAVASYFTFLRWLFWINLVMTVILATFVAIPEVLTADSGTAGERKVMLREEEIKSKHLLTLWEFEGVLKYSPFFYGWYTNQDSQSSYRLPLAYFVTNVVVYIYSFVAILRKMAENSRLSKLTEKEDECIFSWKLFTGWDFMIGNPETAHNRVASIVLGFKEALLEEAEKEKDERKLPLLFSWKIITMRIFVNVSVISLLALSAYAVVKVVARSAEELEGDDWWRQNEITVVMTLITYLFPIFFEILGLLESYHPRKQLRLQLARIMVLNLLNLYSLIFALFERINSMKQELRDLQPTIKNCTYKPIECSNDRTKSRRFATLMSLSLTAASTVTTLQNQSQFANTTLQRYSLIPNYLLNPILDEKSLEEIYNVEDYPPIDYTYDNYDGDNMTRIGFNDTISSSTGNITEENNFNTTLEYNDTLVTSITEQSSSETTILEGNDTDVTGFPDENVSVNEEDNSTFSFTTDLNESTTFGSSSEATVTVSSITDTSSSTEFSSEESSIFTTLDSITKSATSRFTEQSTEGKIGGGTTDSSVSLDEQVIPLTEKDYIVKCFEQVCTTTTQDTTDSKSKVLDLKTRKKLRRLCWETMFGQELAKLTVMDLVLTIVSTLSIDFFRAVFVRYMNSFWCWDLEKQFPQYGDFKIAENILHLVYNQGMIWMGMFFSPGLTALNLLKLGILMYLRSWAVLTCNVPHEVIFRASRSNNFYFALLLTMLFLCVLPVGYAIVWVEPSWHCGPFSGYKKIYHLATKQLTDSLPEPIQRCLDYIASPGIVIPLIVLMTLIIYYLVSLTGSLREANNDLKIQLRHERTEERRKLFKIVKKREDLVDTTLLKWKKVLPALSRKSTKNRASKGEQEAAVTMDHVVDTHGRNHSVSEVAELTDVEEDILQFGHTEAQHTSENTYRGPTNEGNRMIKVLHDSWESQSSDCTVIPEIRINEAEGKPERHSPSTSIENYDPRQTK